MSGTLPPCIVVVSLDLNASFSSTVMLILMFLCAAMYCLAASAQIVFIGSLFWMCHHSIVTGPEALLAEESLLSSPPPHATTSAADASAAAATRIDFTIFSLLLHRRSWVL